MSPQAGGKPELPSDHYRPTPRRDSPLTANLLATRSPCLPPWYAARSQSQKALFLVRPGRIAPTQIDFRRPTSEPLETFMIEIAISCDMSHTLDSE